MGRPPGVCCALRPNRRLRRESGRTAGFGDDGLAPVGPPGADLFDAALYCPEGVDGHPEGEGEVGADEEDDTHPACFSVRGGGGAPGGGWGVAHRAALSDAAGPAPGLTR